MRIWLVVFVLACLSPGVRATQSDQEFEEFTRAITEELRTSHPEAVEAFEQANAARERGAAAEAERLYRAVLAAAPDFLHAQRRLCGVIAEQGRREEALKLARALCSKAPGSDNHAALLAILTAAPSLSPVETSEVRALTRKLMSDRAAGTEQLLRAAQGAVTGQDIELLKTAVARLLQLAPEDHRAHYFAVVEAMTVGDEARAEAELAEALRLGMPAEVHASLAHALEEQRPLPLRALQAGVRFSATANLCLRAAAEKKTVPQSLYVPWPVSPEIEGKIEQAIQASIEAEPSPYDSHPSPRDRFAWVAALDASASTDPDDERPAWELFEERAELEQHMTRQLLKQVRVARR